MSEKMNSERKKSRKNGTRAAAKLQNLNTMPTVLGTDSTTTADPLLTVGQAEQCMEET